MLKGRHGVVYYSSVVCKGYIIPFRTLYGCIYTNNAWCYSVCSCDEGFPTAEIVERTEVKAPRFFYVSLTRKTK